jgi:predicted enzyme related to lactoylglutathione lyase
VDRGDAAVAIGFAVARLDEILTGWVAAGGAVIDPPGRLPTGERMATLRDADGHVVYVSEVPSERQPNHG